jgi:hypothetical protein
MNYNLNQTNKTFHLQDFIETELPVEDLTCSNARKTSNNISEEVLFSLKSKLNNMKKENLILQTEIEEVENLMSNIIEESIKVSEEAVEAKTQLSLLKKNIEMKRSYLDFLMKMNKSRSEKIHLSQTEKIKEILNKINSVTESINNKNLESNQLSNFEISTFDSLLKS